MESFDELSRPAWLRYGVALLATLIALAVTRGMWGLFQGIPFMLPILAICVSGWFGGGGPGMLSTLLSATGITYFLLDPVDWFRAEPMDLFRLGIFLGVGGTISVLNRELWRSRRERARSLKEEREARRIAESTNEELRRLAAIIQSSEDAIVAKDLDGIITAWNPAAEKLYRYDASEMIGSHISRIVPPERERDMEEILTRIKNGETIEHFESVRVRKDGTHVPVSLSVSPIKDRSGKIVGAAKIARDITERKKAEEAILEARRQLDLALTAARMGVWSWDLRTRNLSWSEMLEAIYGLAPRTFGGTYESFLELIHPEDRGGVETELRRAIDQASICDAEFRVRFPDGSIHWVAIHAQAFADARGNPSRMIGIGVDVTERRRAQEERERLYGEAQEAVKARDAFLSVAGHEFRTPLGALSLTIHNLTRLIGRSGDTKFARAVQMVERQVERLSRLTEDLLEVGRINAGKLQLQPEETELIEVVREVTERLEETAARSGSRFELAAGGPVVGFWDRSRLDQVVTNLLTNALKFGSGKPVEVTVAANNGVARLTVRDHGIGIPSEDQSRIFERFERAAPNRAYQGIGLGLWITRQIVEAHGGSIGVESRPGEGAEFRVELPGGSKKG